MTKQDNGLPKAFIVQVVRAYMTGSLTPDEKRLTATHLLIARKLAFAQKPNPSHADLAGWCRCAKRTVARALARLQALGLLSWERRVVKVCGWRAKISNAYLFLCTKPLTSLEIGCGAKESSSGISESSPLLDKLRQWRDKRNPDLFEPRGYGGKPPRRMADIAAEDALSLLEQQRQLRALGVPL